MSFLRAVPGLAEPGGKAGLLVRGGEVRYIPEGNHAEGGDTRTPFLRNQSGDGGGEGTGPVPLQQQTQHTARLFHVYEPSAVWRLKSTLQATLVRRDDTGSRVGWAWSESLSWRRLQWLQLSAVLTWFHTSDYATRLYTYEPSLFYTFGMSALYDHGLRGVLLAQVRLPYRLDLLARVGWTNYFRRTTIGTALDQIPQSHREDLQVQVRWRF